MIRNDLSRRRWKEGKFTYITTDFPVMLLNWVYAKTFFVLWELIMASQLNCSSFDDEIKSFQFFFPLTCSICPPIHLLWCHWLCRVESDDLFDFACVCIKTHLQETESIKFLHSETSGKNIQNLTIPCHAFYQLRCDKASCDCTT